MRKRGAISYFLGVSVPGTFEDALELVRHELQREGFGVLTEIDVQATLKRKLDVDFRPYRILGACNPPFVYRALQQERMIGTMLPCNMTVEQTEEAVEIAAVDRVAPMAGVDNQQLMPVAKGAREAEDRRPARSEQEGRTRMTAPLRW